jgi:hypothetical protein
LTLLQPIAALTDLLLGLVAFALAWGCLRRFRRTGSARTGWWALGYAALGIGAVLGFVNLGFATGLAQPIYYVARFAVGLAVFAMLNAVVGSLVGRESGRRWRLAFALAFCAYYGATLLSDSFLIFIAYSGVGLVAVLGLEAYRWLGRREPGAGWMTLGIALSIGAAVLQAAQLSLTLVWTFDHNAIYHLVQLAALLVLYRGIAAEATGKGAQAARVA